MLFSTLKANISIQHLSLEGNLITRNGIIMLSDVIRFKDNIKYVNLSHRGLENEGLNALIDAADINPSIIMIDIDANSGLDYKAKSHLQTVLEKNRKKYEDDKKSEW